VPLLNLDKLFIWVKLDWKNWAKDDRKSSESTESTHSSFRVTRKCHSVLWRRNCGRNLVRVHAFVSTRIDSSYNVEVRRAGLHGCVGEGCATDR
jgi:hypothetical protein